MGNSASQEMKASVISVERIIGYRFKNKRLLEEALTHSSHPSSGSKSVSYHRLEFVGDAVIGLAISNYFFQTYPQLNPGDLTKLCSANVSNEKLARVAVRHGLYQYVRRDNVGDDHDDLVSKFAEGAREEAPKMLADIVESIAAAVYYDVNLDLQKLWVILKDLLEPIIITIEDLEERPIRNLYDPCLKQGKPVEIKYRTKTVASVYVDGCFVASASSEQKEIARPRTAKSASLKLPQSRPDDVKKWTEPTCFQFFLSVLFFWFLYTLVSKLL